MNEINFRKISQYYLFFQKIRTKYETDKEKFRLMKDLLQDEKDKKEDKNDKSGTVGGLWLKRLVRNISLYILSICSLYLVEVVKWASTVLKFGRVHCQLQVYMY